MFWSKYLRDIEKALLAGNATEHTHRPALKNLIETVGTRITAARADDPSATIMASAATEK